ncbi:hypothetical protein [Streptomyces sp. 1222.5]|uniref:hypothetical protein n=1 Tax=Streptomyces sp. 1222.5 TaxID=1881026 RepID=UPI003EBC1898
MPDPSTTRLGLYKSKSDGSELVTYTQDIGQNLDKLDLAVGFQACTSTTRPSTPFSGKPIFETDTSYRSYFSNGTSPASASWVEIPNGSATYNSNLTMASGKQINLGGSGSPASIAVLNTLAGTDMLTGRVTGDTQSRFVLDTDGTMNWGPGGASATDVNLFRSATNTLRTNDNLTVDLALSVGGALTVTGNINSAANLTMGAWPTWTPTWTTSNGLHTPSFGNAVVDCRYARIGRTILFYMNITFGNTTNFGASATTADNWIMSLPVAAAQVAVPIGFVNFLAGNTAKAVAGMTHTFDANNLNFYIAGPQNNGTAVGGGIADSLTPVTWASGDRLALVGQYEAAS